MLATCIYVDEIIMGMDLLWLVCIKNYGYIGSYGVFFLTVAVVVFHAHE